MYARIKPDAALPYGDLEVGVPYEYQISEKIWDDDEVDEYHITDGEGVEYSFSPHEVEISKDKFLPGDKVDWVHEDGSPRANAVWDNSEILERCTSALFRDYYSVCNTAGVSGTIHGDDLRIHREKENPLMAAANATHSITFQVISDIKDPAAPTVEELKQGIDITKWVTDISGFEPLPYQEEIIKDIGASYSINGEAVEDDADLINHPDHYTGFSNGAEVIDITENLNFNRGNAVKYLARAGAKDPETEMQDLLKAQWYVNREVNRLDAVIAAQEDNDA